ncbi:GPO family capsid scaffolding protein [Pseudoalteromonas luteoviolacea]|uniref:Precorrin-8W decarboxylase n=1 Tax=Pseudoalteromonas luteoviolacea S4060-1 TaxID=1365257 RepID=A0A167JJD0_9GAMM|nr:GPO family capsid scaffolding protein [Pseudoalteromonas luteoviolacea]KZN61201.1 precorrin-8W decarboxylase [Pseudoalteromonas luteoviolacea S4060-1]
MSDLIVKTEPLSIASVGDTVDGREITDADLDAIIETYNPRMYPARINLDHEQEWSGWFAQHIYNVNIPSMLGDVLELSDGVNDDGVRCLYAVLQPNEWLIKLNKMDQAVFFSIELFPDFRKTGKPYLAGLAVTDYPACTYTDRLKFSREVKGMKVESDKALHKVNFKIKEQKSSWTTTIFSKKDDQVMDETKLAVAFAEQLSGPLSQFSQSLDNLSTKVESFGKQEQEAPPKEGDDNQDDTEQSEVLAQMTQTFTQMSEKLEALGSKVEKLSQQDALETTDVNDDHLDAELPDEPML